jgi:UDP-glucose 4-epimerase
LKTLVTGGAGFIGSNLTRALIDQGHSVRIIDDFVTGKSRNLAGLPCEVIEGSVENLELLNAASQEIDVVFHQAALPSVKRSVEDPIRTHRVNATGTLNVLIAARDAGVRRVVYASSSSAYGDTPVLPKREEMPPSPQSPYAVSKLAGEMYCRVFTRVFGLETVSLRYFNVFGPRQDPTNQYAAVIPLFISAFLNGERPTVFGDGQQTRDFTYIDNVVAANLLAAEGDHRTSGETFNIACGERVDLNELLFLTADLLGISDWTANYVDPRPGDIRDSLAALDKATSLLGYRPEIGLREGLDRTVKWFAGIES